MLMPDHADQGIVRGRFPEQLAPGLSAPASNGNRLYILDPKGYERFGRMLLDPICAVVRV
jgi:hypothetical protein